jgi:hypothetical protein
VSPPLNTGAEAVNESVLTASSPRRSRISPLPLIPAMVPAKVAGLSTMKVPVLPLKETFSLEAMLSS